MSEESLAVRLARAVAEVKRLRAESRALIKSAYIAGERSVEDIAREFSTTSGEIQRRARHEGWPRRSNVQVAAQQQRRKSELKREALYDIPRTTKFDQEAA